MTTDRNDLRRHVRIVLALALSVSVAANVLAAEPSAVGRAVAAWPPLALMLVVDVLGRIPRSPGSLGHLVIAATGGVALVAAVASYSHMRSVALAAGESELVAFLFPLTVDGLAIVCSAGLIELNRRNRSAAPEPPPANHSSNGLAPTSSDDRTVRSLVMLNSNGK